MYGMPKAMVDRPSLREANEPHIAISLVLDVSLSMAGEPIESLNNAVNEMIEQMKEDDILRNIVDLAIFVFGTYKRKNMYRKFTAIADYNPVEIEAADVNTYVVDALKEAVYHTCERTALYNKAGGSHEPWIILITDGEFHDSEAALMKVGDRIKDLEKKEGLYFFGLGVDGYEKEQLSMLTGKPNNIIDIRHAKFIDFFAWVKNSVKIVSRKVFDDDIFDDYVDMELPQIDFNKLR